MSIQRALIPFAMAGGVMLTGAAQAHNIDNLPDLIDTIMPAVVNISIMSIYEGEEYPIAQGSGFVIDGIQGYILTNHHVINGTPDKIVIEFSNGDEVEASIIGSNKDTDIAVLQINYDVVPQVAIGDSDALRVGEDVIAIGNMHGLENTVSVGIVSGKHRDTDEPVHDDFIQTDAAVNPGNSGGPLFNDEGEVVGVNSAIFSMSGGFQGISFAVPINQAMWVAQEIIEKGEVRWGYLGTTIEDLSVPMSLMMDIPGVDGVRITGVNPGSAAAAAGLRVDDVVVRVNGDAVGDVIAFQRSVLYAGHGNEILIEFMRAGQAQEVTAVLGGFAVAEQSIEDIIRESFGMLPQPEDPGQYMLPPQPQPDSSDTKPNEAEPNWYIPGPPQTPSP